MHAQLLRLFVTKLEQETIKGTHAQETSAYQRRPTTQYALASCFLVHASASFVSARSFLLTLLRFCSIFRI